MWFRALPVVAFVLSLFGAALAAQDTPTKGPTETLKNGKEYVHASGGKFRYPASWSLKEFEGGLQLIPPGMGANELYAVLAQSAAGQTDPGAKEVVDYVDQQVRLQLPFVHRVGEVESVSSGSGKGALLTWEGQKGGVTYQVRGFLTILKGYGVSLLAAGPKAKLEKQDKTLREIFYTFGWGQGKLDPQLVGSWSHWSYKGSNGYGRETKASAVLRADGTFSYSSTAETSISANTGSMASRRGSGWGGTWTADGTTLILNFEDGSSETLSYHFNQQSNGVVFLVTTYPNGKNVMEWSRKG